MNEVLTAIKERSSIRAYKPQMPEQEKLDAIINAGLQATTANNKQEVHISVVKTDHPVIEEMATEFTQISAREGAFHYGAPVLVFLSADKVLKFAAVDAGICVENMALAAQSLGLSTVIIGCLWKQFESDKAAYYGEKLVCPENHVYQIALALGYKDTEKEPHEVDWNTHVTVVE